MLRRRFLRGIEQLDGASVGFLPVIRQGPFDYLPYTLLSMETFSGGLRSRYQMLRLKARGFRPCFVELSEFIHRNLPGLKPKHYSRPGMKLIDAFEFSREIHLERDGCRIEDCISGDLEGKTLLFSVRYLPCTSVRLRGLGKRQSIICWGSDGRQTLDLYETRAEGSRVCYECHVGLDSGPSSSTL
jgi:hypothetical protein